MRKLVYIQAVPERKALWEPLHRRLVGSGLFDSVAVSCDEQHKGPAANFRRILTDAEDLQGDVLVLQDDVILHRQFFEHIPAMFNHLGVCQFISLFVPPRKLFRDLQPDTNFVRNPDHLWQPAVMFTSSICRRLRMFKTAEAKHDDVLVNQFLRSERLAAWVCIPSLVKHNTFVRSAVGNPGRERQTESWWPEIPAGRFEAIRA